MRGEGSTLHCAFISHECLVKDNGTGESAYLWYCWCDVCNRKTDPVMTVGESMERAEFGWWATSSHDRINEAWRDHMRKGRDEFPEPAPAYEYESDIWKNDLGLA